MGRGCPPGAPRLGAAAGVVAPRLVTEVRAAASSTGSFLTV
jgi:hypothetical protein